MSKMEYHRRRIPDFYRGKSVFITGGTGFIGKTLIEKLLYTCTDIDKLYLLVRDRKGVNCENRFGILFDDPIFTRLNTEKPEYLNKVVPVRGDLSSKRLITNDDDRNMLIDTISVIFHVAATIRFNEPLKVAMSINYEGTMKVLELCRQMKNLNSVVHVSTTFLNPKANVLEEKMYPFPMTVEDVYSKLDAGDFFTEDYFGIQGHWPNTYVFTKALTESMIAEKYRDIPLVIVRPSVVLAMKDDPLPGWIDNWAGATALLYPAGKGYDRVVLGNVDNVIDVIPVDYVSNVVIITATTAKSFDIGIFNICTSSCNPITLKFLSDTYIESAVNNGYNDIYYPHILYTESPIVEQTIQTIIKLLAILGDLASMAWNQPSRYSKLHSNICAVHEVLNFFTTRSWMMRCDAARSLYQTLDPADRELFPCDPTDISWKKYIATYCDGIERYLVKKTKSVKS